MIQGKVWKLDHDVNTDVILPGKYLHISDPLTLSKHCFEGIDIELPKRINPGDIVVAGRNFGCGSSREHAPVAIKAIGIGAVVAITFARIFYRNAINIGLSIFESPELYHDIREGDILQIDESKGTLANLTLGQKSTMSKFPEFIQKIIKSGGLINYGRQRLANMNP